LVALFACEEVTAKMQLLSYMMDMMNRMRHWGNGEGWWWMFGFGILGLILVGVVIYLLVRNYSIHDHGPVPFHGPGGPGYMGHTGLTENPLDIAKRRFASGEINHEEFDKIVKGIKEADKNPPGETG
jgi:uncharacterized membrane protein